LSSSEDSSTTTMMALTLVGMAVLVVLMGCALLLLLRRRGETKHVDSQQVNMTASLREQLTSTDESTKGLDPYPPPSATLAAMQTARIDDELDDQATSTHDLEAEATRSPPRTPPRRPQPDALQRAYLLNPDAQLPLPALASRDSNGRDPTPPDTIESHAAHGQMRSPIRRSPIRRSQSPVSLDGSGITEYAVNVSLAELHTVSICLADPPTTAPAPLKVSISLSQVPAQLTPDATPSTAPEASSRASSAKTKMRRAASAALVATRSSRHLDTLPNTMRNPVVEELLRRAHDDAETQQTTARSFIPANQLPSDLDQEEPSPNPLRI